VLERGLLGELSRLLVARATRVPLHGVERGPLRVDDLPELPGDLLEDASQVVPPQLLAPPAAKALEQVPKPGYLLAVGPAQPFMEEAAEGGVDVAVVDDVVGQLVEHLVGVELEPGLGAVPA
jgi:hypothetical protein